MRGDEMSRADAGDRASAEMIERFPPLPQKPSEPWITDAFPDEPDRSWLRSPSQLG